MGRFSYHEKKEPVKVEIEQLGFCIPRMDGEMDRQLMPILTQQEYSEVIQKCNSTLFWHYPNIAFWATCGLLFCIGLLVVGTQVFGMKEDEYFECAERNGLCDAQASIVSDCCRYLCCPRTMSNLTHTHVHSHTFDSPAHSHDFELDMGSCDVIGATQDEECDCETKLVTTTQIDTSGNDWEESKEETTCSRFVRVEGETKLIPAKHEWGVPVGIACFTASLLSWCVSFVIVFIRLRVVRRFMHANLRPWASKGLEARYCPGEHNYKPRIIVTFPPERAEERVRASQRESVKGQENTKGNTPSGIPPPQIIAGSEATSNP